MPESRRQRYTHAFLSADTRILELFVSLFTFVWSGWLLSLAAGWAEASPSLPDMIQTQGGLTLWGTCFLGASVFQACSIWINYPRLKRWAGFINGAFWGYAAIGMALVEPRLFYLPMSLLLLMAEFFLIAHGSALKAPKDLQENGRD